MKKTLSALLFFGSIFIFSQAKFLEIKPLSVEELKATKSKIEPDAPAEILYRTMHHTVHLDGNIESVYTERIKIYDRDKAGDYLNPEISVFDNTLGARQTLRSLQAVTYNLDGDNIVVDKVQKDSKFRSKEDKNYNITKFAFANVKNGSVIEYKYMISSPQDFLMMIPKFTVEKAIPSRYTDYFLDVPKSLGYNIDYQGMLMPSNRQTGERSIYGGDYQVYRFAYENLPGYHDEEFVINNDNFKTAIKAELNSTYFNNELKSYSLKWDDIKDRLMKDDDFGMQMKKRALVKNLIPAEVMTATSKKMKADLILKYVQKNFTWNKEVSVYTDKGINNLIMTKIGNSTEINMLLYILMKEAGLDVSPVVLPTVGRGQIKSYLPTITLLNYMFVALTDADSYLYYDATSKNADVYELPRFALNGAGLMLRPDKAQLVQVYYPLKSQTHLTVDAKLNPDATFTGTFADRDTNLYANFVHETFLDDKAEFEKTYKDKYKFPFTDLKSGMKDDGDFETTFNFQSDGFVDAIGNKLVFNPMLFLFLKNHEFNQTEKRKSPLEFITANERIKKVTITLPEGYVFENVPASKKIRTDDEAIEYTYSVKKIGLNQLVVETTTKINDASYAPEYYAAFKQIFDNITKLEGQVVTAVKK